jgi:hypothetical protein
MIGDTTARLLPNWPEQHAPAFFGTMVNMPLLARPQAALVSSEPAVRLSHVSKRSVNVIVLG